MRKLVFLLLLPIQLLAQGVPNSVVFWDALITHCGKSYEGEIVAGGKEGDGFTGEKLVMHVRSCEENTIRIPFFVGDDKSRTWVFTMDKDNLIQLKHDHRHKDGSEYKITQYGGMSSNVGLANLQVFPADKLTAELIPAAATNVWWITIDKTSFTYSLRRIGSERYFSVKFDTTKEIETPSAPWGSEN
ncbi:hypothetical protein QWY81_00995 [Polaribacter undariae]|uniref:Secreted protein n=1 Tax=Polaribacter sejongensis TaxID=985043 RepID=A0AAJ1VEL2_9FLAO|nr:hypothetical protein [Polaribacter undariae]MDN3618026.1 hypothetical protein [Polaribacter undariae]UWD31942.1 hypothetical protein NQP51_17670 [Polaribacter undariae]